MTLAILLIAALLGACSPREAKDKAATAVGNATERIADAFDAAVPVGDRDDPAQRERERFDERWRQLASFREAAAAARRAAPARPQIQLTFVTGTKESLKDVDPATIDRRPLSVPIIGDVSGPSVLKAQVLLDQVHFSVGVIDGRWGKNSAITTWWYQRSRGLNATGEMDEETFRALATEASNAPTFITHTLTAEDVKGPFTPIPEDMYEKAKLDCLCYESLAEKLAEKFHTTIELLELVNPEKKLDDLRDGDRLVAPNVRPWMTTDQPDITRVVVSIAGNSFSAYNAAGEMVFHAPTTLGSQYDPSPRETLEVRKVVFNPHFHYQPKLFAEVPDDEPEANLHPGPNSPVGVVWAALSKRHFGIHGTSDPDSIGYASSHGCVRLTNWDANEIGHRLKPGVPVQFLDTRRESGSASAE